MRCLARSTAAAVATAVAAAACCDTALAHTLPVAGVGHSASFAAGFGHPLTGLDHLLGMLAVGLWAGTSGGRALYLWPAAFVALMSLGGALGMAYPSLTTGEGVILASVVVLGLLLFAGVALPVLPGALLIALFALAHGHAHGVEMPARAVAASYAGGFLLATAMLHGIGIGLARLCARSQRWPAMRGAGAVIALTGMVLAAI
jgi:urease accessory protein